MGCEAAHDRWRTGRALVLQGRLQLVRRELNEAVRTFEQALAALRDARASRDPARAEALIFLGTTLAYLGKHDLAIKCYAEAARAQATRHDLLIQGRALWGLGLSYRRLGSLELAAEHLNKAKEAFEKIEELPDLAAVLHNIGQLAYQQKRFSDALRCFTQALRVAERLSLKISRASMLTEIARVHVATSNLDDANAVAEQALEAAQDAQDPMETAEAKTVLAAACARTGRADRAKELMAEALAAFRTQGAHARIAQTARDLGQTFMRQGAKADAADQLVIAMEAEEALREQSPSQAT